MIDYTLAYDKTIKDVQFVHKYSDEVVITFEDDSQLTFSHDQECCETVSLEDYEYSYKDLKGSVLRTIEVRTKNKEVENISEESYMWTFYNIVTSKGDLHMRWYGQSNGYYSVGVNIKYWGI